MAPFSSSLQAPQSSQTLPPSSLRSDISVYKQTKSSPLVHCRSQAEVLPEKTANGERFVTESLVHEDKKKRKAERKARKQRKREEREAERKARKQRKREERAKRKLEEDKEREHEEKQHVRETNPTPEEMKKSVHEEEKKPDLEDVFYTPQTNKFADSTLIKREGEHKQNGASSPRMEASENRKQRRAQEQAERAASSPEEGEGVKKDKTSKRDKTPKKDNLNHFSSPSRKPSRSFHRTLFEELEKKVNKKTAADEVAEKMDTEDRD
ncbi:hypothetical protein GE09DRAFT_1230438 [Coniochaeta sp. 2T2.1]|nr:hypothetical protein GE09DRAFT_1230438 [Coniochaeta sp. 2T2.1]